MPAEFCRWTAWSETTYEPAAQPATACEIVPRSWRKATWSPTGASGEPAVMPVPLPVTPAVPAKVQADWAGP